MIHTMHATVSATSLKHRLGEVLHLATLGRVAIVRHGRVIAYLVPAAAPKALRARPGKARTHGLSRQEEERLLELCASGDFRPSRWRRAGDAKLLAGLAALLGSAGLFDPARLFALAERLKQGMGTVRGFGAWLESAPVDPARFLPMLEARLKEKAAGRAS